MLRDYQIKIKNDIYKSWDAGNRNILVVSPCGSGKTVTMQSVTEDCNGVTMSIAHRRELVGQISLAAARAGVHHRIIAPQKIVALISHWHVKELGRSFIHPGSSHCVASVDTIISRADEIGSLLKQVREFQQDEAHHCLITTKWGRAIALMVNARGVGWTGTPLRADRRALRRDAGGVFDDMVLGPDVRELIDAGYLADYEIYGPPLSIDATGVEVGADGDYKRGQLHDAAEKSTITGDIVEWYLKLTPGKVGATFVVDLDFAEQTTKRYLHYGVPAAMISANTPDAYRGQVMFDLRCGIIKQVVNVDILGEGVDVPGLEVVSQGRPTMSFALNRQQQGRAMRPKPGGTRGIIIDHVGNTDRHGPPDKRMLWSLDAPERKRKDAARDPDEVPVRRCGKCWRLFESWGQACIHCGDVLPVTLATRPKEVEGNLLLYSPELLASLGAEASRVMSTVQIPRGVSPLAAAGIEVTWRERAEMQTRLRNSMAQWAGIQRHVCGRSDAEAYVRFTRLFGVDVATAQTLGATKARELDNLIWKDIEDDR